jgi:hypothetical protein
MASAERIEAAAKAAYPELWPEGDVPMEHRAGLAIARQQAVTRIAAAVEAADSEGDSQTLGKVDIALPDDAAMVQQTLTVVAFIDNEGRTAYSVFTTGEGLLASWVGMAALAQNYLLHQGGMQ